MRFQTRRCSGTQPRAPAMNPPPPPTRSEAEPETGRKRPAGLPRLLEGIPSHGGMSLAEHLALHGPLPAWRRRARGGEHPLIAQVEQAGLRGRGGAGFPLAVKLRAVAASRGHPVVVINAADGEPASLKDRTLTQILPHLVLDGAALAAHALGASEIVVSVCESARASAESIAEAITERGSPGRDSPRIRLGTIPTHYVAEPDRLRGARHVRRAPARANRPHTRPARPAPSMASTRALGIVVPDELVPLLRRALLRSPRPTRGGRHFDRGLGRVPRTVPDRSVEPESRRGDSNSQPLAYKASAATS